MSDGPPESLPVMEGRCLMDPTFEHFGEKIIRISPALSKNADFEYRCENEFASGILTLDRTFCIKKWISLLEDAFRNDRVLSFQQSGCANKRKKWARRQRTARNRFLASVSLYSTCEKTSIFRESPF